ncbi:MAG: deoxyribose-phosphate aldolase [Anaerolineae bacterium]|nr:deoxyribose-phosphate aldolase [Anaerolineae bacterium]
MTSGNKLTVSDIARMVDHSLLRPTLTDPEFDEGIELVKKYRCATVMVAPYDVPRAVERLAGSGIAVSTVVDFPHGSNLTKAKVYEAQLAMDNGAVHLDMVLAISRLVAGHDDYVEEDIRAVVEAGHARNVPVKVIFETCYLTDDQIVTACKISERAGADFVKTSTGYGPGGATLEAVRLMRASCSPKVQVKPSGGIRTLDQVLEYRKAGATMIGTRATAAILDEAVRREAEGTLKELD